jgi:hypothetical protein
MQEDAVLTYNKSDMILAVHSDVSYLSEPKARSRAGGYFFLSTNAQIPKTMAPSSTLSTLSNTSCPPQQKQNWQPST